MEPKTEIQVKYRVYQREDQLWYFAIAVVTPKDTQYVQYSPGYTHSALRTAVTVKYDEYPFFAAGNEQEAHDAAHLYIKMLISNIEDDLKRWSEPFYRPVLKIDTNEVPVEFDRTLRPGEIRFSDVPDLKQWEKSKRRFFDWDDPPESLRKKMSGEDDE